MQKIVLLLLAFVVAFAAADLLTIKEVDSNVPLSPFGFGGPRSFVPNPSPSQKRQSGCSPNSCPSGETCCQLAGGQVGCCPAANACCCPDQQHCCGVGKCVCNGGSCTGCSQNGQCSNQKRSLFEVTRE